MSKQEEWMRALSAHHRDKGWLQTRPGERCLIRSSSADTCGAYSVVEIVSQPGDGTPVHVHKKEDEHFVILEGTARFLYGDKVFDLSAGSSVSALRNIPHAWCNPFDVPFRMVAIASPGGCEEALQIIAQGGDIDFAALGEKFQVEVIGPPMLAS